MGKIVNISEAAGLALHAMVLLAQAEDSKPLKIEKMAERMGVGTNHLAKVLQILGRQGMVKSVRGPAGGFCLHVDAAAVTLLQIYEAIDGPINCMACAGKHLVCPYGRCLMGGILSEATNLVKNYLESFTLKAFTEPG